MEKKSQRREEKEQEVIIREEAAMEGLLQDERGERRGHGLEEGYNFR